MNKIISKIKRRLLAISIVAVLFTFLSQGTVAYYSTVGTATNVITSGEVKMQIVEKGYGDTVFPEEGVYVIPGDIVTKRVSVKSLCEAPFYLRVKIVYGINATELPFEECFKLDINEQSWIYSDGWYYYDGIVAPGEETPVVFSKVEIVGNKVDNNYIGKTLTLTVDAEAVQSENNPIPEEGITAVTGWPAAENEAENDNSAEAEGGGMGGVGGA